MKKQNMKNLQGTANSKNLEPQTPQATNPRKTGPLEPQETRPVQRLSMTSDLVFRTVLGRDTPECKRALIAVLNLILDRQTDPIVDLEYKNPFHLNEYMVGKQTVMDIKVSTSSGEIINVEMQVEKLKSHANRSLLYTGQISEESLESGEDYDKIKKVAHISIVSGRMKAGSDKYHGIYRYLEVSDKVELSDLVELHYLKLNKLPGKPLGEMSSLERFGYYLANSGRADRQEEIETLVGMGEEAIVLTDAVLRKVSQEEILREQEIARKWWEMDRRVEERAYREEGREEGLKKGREEGIKSLIETCKEFERSREETKSKVAEKFDLDEKAAEEHMRQYW